VVPAVLIALSACGSSAPSSTGAPSSRAAVSNPTVPAATVPASTAPFGPGCAALAAIRSAQLTGLTAERVTSAATHHLALSSLVTAVSKAQLLAPANAAFRAFPRATLTALLGDTPRLTRLLTHHVIEGRLTPQQLAGTHTTLANDTVTIAASGGTFTISGDQTVLRSRPATVVCGNIRTANATVYIIDQVLAPRG
jgi:uncharacterized surface protein with fasciclin (FAS1) repeats